MSRKFFERLVTNDDLHPDMTLTPLITSGEAPMTLLPTTSTNFAAVDIHPDFDFDLALVKPSVEAALEAGLDALDRAISLEELWREEEVAAHNSVEPDFFALPPENQPLDIDWNLELAWAAASGETGVEGAADAGWLAFDFDVADLGPDPEASAEETLPALETATARDRRLDAAAAELVLSLGAFRVADRRGLHRRFRTVVEEFQHPASHTALRRLLGEGASLEDIEEAAQLRCLWRDQPWLWAEKRSAMSSWSVRRSPVQRLAFGWPTAIRLVRTFGLIETARAMGENWFDAWTELERAKAVSPVEVMAFFTYAGFLRQLTPATLLETPEGVYEEAADAPERLQLRDNRGSLVWQFERKLAPRAGELSLEPARIRNHSYFEEAACEDNLGLAYLVALSPAEAIATGFCRTYLFPMKRFDGAAGTRAKISSLACHGLVKIVGLDREACKIILAVTHDQKRLLEMNLALIAEPPPPKPIGKEDKLGKDRNNAKKKENTK